MTFPPELVSIVIPTCNGKSDLLRLLPALFSQKADFRFEVICIDSGSGDGTWELLETYPVRRVRIASSQFSHGGTRNLGIEISRGPIVVLLTQDAIPDRDDWLATLVSNYADPRVAGVYCRQVPRPDGPLLPKIDARLWVTGRQQRHENRLGDHPDYPQLPPHQRRLLCNFDDICSSLRKSVWEQFPYRPVNFAEDLEWGKRVFEAGYTLVFEPRARVVHSHDRSFVYELKRSFLTYETLDRLFGIGDEGYTFRQALRDVARAPWGLPAVYPDLRQEPPGDRLRAYWIILARALGRASYALWHRRLRSRPIGRRIQRCLTRGV